MNLVIAAISNKTKWLYHHPRTDSITLPEFWVWKLSESGPAEIARKVGNLPEFWVWKLPEIKASFFAAALKKTGHFFMLL